MTTRRLALPRRTLCTMVQRMGQRSRRTGEDAAEVKQKVKEEDVKEEPIEDLLQESD